MSPCRKRWTALVRLCGVLEEQKLGRSNASACDRPPCTLSSVGTNWDTLAQSAFNQKKFNCGGENAVGYSTCNDFVRSYATNSFNYAVYGNSAYTIDSVTLEARISGRAWTKLSRHTSKFSEKHGVIVTFNLAYITEQLSTTAKYLRDNSGFEVRAKVEAVAVGGSSTRHNCAAVDVTYNKGGSNEIWRYRKSGSSASYLANCRYPLGTPIN
jgi:hypothetical protein